MDQNKIVKGRVNRYAIGGYLLIILLSILSLLYPSYPVMILLMDTAQYHHTSDLILSGNLFTSATHQLPTEYRIAIRPPVYPLFIFLASVIEGSVPASVSLPGIVLVHIAFATLLLIAVPLLLRPYLPLPLTSAATGIALLSAKQVAWADMSEWVATCFTLLVVVTYLRFAYTRLAREFGLMAMWISCAILTRTALVFLLIFAFVGFIQTQRSSRLKVMFLFLLGMIPCVVWKSLLLCHTSSISSGLYEANNLIATARTISPIALGTDDTPAQIHFISILNERGMTSQLDHISARDVHAFESDFYNAFHHNFTLVDTLLSESRRAEAIAPWLVFYDTVIAHPDKYFSFLIGGIHTFVSSSAPLSILCLMIGLWAHCRSEVLRPFATVAITLAIISMIYVGSILGVMLWLPRYFIPLQASLLFCVVVGTTLLLRALSDASSSLK